MPKIYTIRPISSIVFRSILNAINEKCTLYLNCTNLELLHDFEVNGEKITKKNKAKFKLKQIFGKHFDL